VTLLPQAWDERRDLALVLGELGRLEAASDSLQRYLLQRPDAEDADRMQQQLASWRARIARATGNAR